MASKPPVDTANSDVQGLYASCEWLNCISPRSPHTTRNGAKLPNNTYMLQCHLAYKKCHKITQHVPQFRS